MRYLRIAAVAAFLLAPVAVVSLALAPHRATLADCRPSWNDDVNYWNEIACFERAGFSGGYCVVDERPAPATWTHFGPHGPAFAVLYGLPARFFGWHATSGPFFNVAVTAVAAAIWLWLVRPDWKQLTTATALLATFWPMILHLPATYQDSLHFAIAIVLAGIAQRALRQPASFRAFLPFLIGVLAASLIRLTWVLLVVPWVIVALPGKRWFGKGATLLVTACTIPAMTWAWGEICSPYDDLLSNRMANAWQYPMSEFWNLLLRWERAWSMFFLPSNAPLISLLQRYEIIALLLLGAGLFALRKNRREAAFAALNLAVVLVPTMLLYGLWDWHDYRILAPHVLLALLVLLGADYRLAWPFVVANVLFVGPFLGQFAQWISPRLRPDVAAPFREAITRLVSYDPSAGPWGNTILVPVDLWSPTLEGIPSGVGATMYLHDDRLKRPVRSHWVLLHGQRPEHFGRLKLLAIVPVDSDPPSAELYENLDCPKQ
jgi:hypothetical protein